jgi:membrane-bound ClpP family serine protease
MYSTAIEVLGLGCFVVMAALLGGTAAAFGVAGVALLFVGASTDDSAMGVNVRAAAALPLRAVLGARNVWRRQLLVENMAEALREDV